MQKLMTVMKNTTRSAFILGLMLQAGHAMDKNPGFEDSENTELMLQTRAKEIMDEVPGVVQEEIKANIAIATQLVINNSPILPEQYARPLAGAMRTGDSVEIEIDEKCRILGLTSEGIEFIRQQIAEDMHPQDLLNAQAFLAELANQ